MRRLALAFGFFCLCLSARASNFNEVMPGAKAMGMGMAFTAVADDPSAMFFNPAGTANTPYTQSGMSVGRILSPIGTMSFANLTYLRPYDPINTATVGSSYYSERQTHGNDRDILLFHYAQEVKLPEFGLSRPLKVGGNFKFINVDLNKKSRFGAGFDGGLLASSNYGLSGSMVLTDLTTNVGTPRGLLTFGTAYTWLKRFTVALDMRFRPHVTEFYPGLEASFHEGLLKVRAGKGLSLDGVHTVALGIGVDFSPIVLDVAMSLPMDGPNRQGGGFQSTFNYRFGAPSFTGHFVGQAAGEAETLRSEIERLEEQKKNIEETVRASQSHGEMAVGELEVVKQRVKELQEEYRKLQRKRDDINYEIEAANLKKRLATTNPPPPPALPKAKPLPPPPPPPAWPKKHIVVSGETLRTIAKDFYEDPNLWEEIYNANLDKIDRGLPQEGATLVIPEPK